MRLQCLVPAKVCCLNLGGLWSVHVSINLPFGNSCPLSLPPLVFLPSGLLQLPRQARQPHCALPPGVSINPGFSLHSKGAIFSFLSWTCWATGLWGRPRLCLPHSKGSSVSLGGPARLLLCHPLSLACPKGQPAQEGAPGGCRGSLQLLLFNGQVLNCDERQGPGGSCSARQPFQRFKFAPELPALKNSSLISCTGSCPATSSKENASRNRQALDPQFSLPMMQTPTQGNLHSTCLPQWPLQLRGGAVRLACD